MSLHENSAVTAPEKPKQRHAGGRPTKYSQPLAALVCARISEGNSIRKVCEAEDMPAPSTIYLWLGQHPQFSEQYRRACDDRADFHFEEMLDIADDKTSDFTTTEDGREIFNTEHVQRSRLRVDTRKWFVSKLNPKKYGDKLDLNAAVTVDDRSNARKTALVGMVLALAQARDAGADLPQEALDFLAAVRGDEPKVIEG